MVCSQNRGMILMLILALSVAAQDQMAPDGLRLALGLDPSAMRVAWQTYDVLKAETKVMWGSKADDLEHSAVGGATVFTSDPERNWTMHTAEMTGLAPSSQYFYKVGGATGWSDIFEFKSQANADTLKDQLPQVHVILGDMGSAFAYSLCDSCGSAERCICANKSAGVISEKPDMILHTGDFAYNMDTNGGTTADNFFKNIQPVAANYPYMVSHGNHEDGDVALARYTESFRHMPTKTGTVKSVNGVAPNNWYFSWDSGLVHYISISTEIQGGAMLTRGGYKLIADQFNWLEADLIEAKETLESTELELTQLANMNAELHKSCDFVLANFDVRQSARAQEVEALRQAKAILSGSGGKGGGAK